MLQKIWQWILRFFGLASAEDKNPEIVLRKHMEDLRARVPQMNRAVIEVMRTEALLRSQVDQLQYRIKHLETQVIAAVKLGPAYENDAKTLIAAMQQARESLGETRKHHEVAAHAVLQAKSVREEYMTAMDARCKEAMRAIEKNRRAQAQERLVDLLESLESPQTSPDVERTKERIRQRAALAEARLELAAAANPIAEVNRATAEMGIEEQLLEYKRQVGVGPKSETSQIAPTQQTHQQKA